MPVYNGAEYVEEAIRSLLAQTEGDFILHISDNCSEDATSEICIRLANEDARIRYERQERNMGATANFLHVLEAAGTPYFMWAAHDDVWDPDFLRETLNCLQDTPAAVGCAVGVRRRYLQRRDGRVFEQTRAFPPPFGLTNHHPEIRARAAFQPGAWHAIYGLYRRDALRIGDPVVHDVPFGDVLFVFRMTLRGLFAVNNNTLQVLRDVERGRKASGSEGHLYSDNPSSATRLMWQYAGEPGLLSRRELASVRVFVAWRWLTYTRDSAARANLEEGSRAYREARYIRLAIIMLKQLFLRPSDLLHQARRHVGRSAP
jgi:glycosyltransferase involved in cell wall biosynthesis